MGREKRRIWRKIAKQNLLKPVPAVDYVEKRVNLQEQNVAVSGFVMMLTSMFSFLMLEIVAIETMTDIHFVRIIIMKDIRVIGKSAKSVGEILKLKCTYGMELTSTILRNLQTPPKYEPTKCAKCRKIIKLGEDGYSIAGGQYLCEKCGGLEL